MSNRPPSELAPTRSVKVLSVARDRAIDRLSEAFARGALEVEEFERRVTLAQRSDSPAEMDNLVADLEVSTEGAPVPAKPAAPSVLPPALVKSSGTVFAMLGGVERRGTWTVPRVLNVVAIMGGTMLDLREARLPQGSIELRVAALMGGVEIIVPPHLAVESNGAAIMGGFEHVERAPQEPDPEAPVLRISGIAFMGGVSIEMRLPGESSREAKRRRKKELRARRLEKR